MHSFAARLTVPALFVCLAAAPLWSQDKPDAKGQKTETKKTESKEDAAETLRAHRKKLRQLRHDLEIAELQLESAALERQIQTATTEAALLKAGRGVDSAKKDLEHFEKRTAPRELESARIELDRARYAAEHAKDEHRELEAMYKADEFAEMTKELVLKRSRRSMELADRSLAVKQGQLDSLEKVEHPRKLEELRAKLEDATAALGTAGLQRQKTALEQRIGGMKADFKLEELRRDLKAAVEKEKTLAAAAEKKS